jgi:hypothetical protein
MLQSNCGQKRNEHKSADIEKVRNSDSIRLDTFNFYPDDIEGCSCSCSNSLTDFNLQEHICVTSYWDIAYLKLNGELTRFKLIKHDILPDSTTIVSYENEKFKLTIESKFTETEYESSSIMGTIRLENTAREILTRKFVGGCGC